MQARILRRLDRLDVIVRPEEMNIPGFDFHPLRGFKPTRYSVHVNGPWCITFEFEKGDFVRSISNNITEGSRSWFISLSVIRNVVRPIPALCCGRM